MSTDGDLKKIFRDHLPREIHWQRIESGTTSLGIPDVNYCWRGSEGWIENKQTTGWTIKIRPEQVGWLLRRARAGGRVLIAVRRRTRTVDELYVCLGQHADDVLRKGIRGTPWSIVGEGGPVRWPWVDVGRLLLGSPAPGRSNRR